MSGWICLHRALLDKPIWQLSTPAHKSILITMVLMANHEPKEWEWMGKKFTVNPGQFVTSLDSIKRRCGKGVGIQQIRRAIARFKKLDFCTSEATKTGRLITILNWEKYQSKEDCDRQSNRQSTDKAPTPNNNDNNVTKNYKAVFEEVIGYLNLKTGKNFRWQTKDTQKKINGRISDGYTVDDFKRVIDNKTSEWLGDLKYEKYLCPETLFRPSKFEKYLNQKKQTKPTCGLKRVPDRPYE